MDEVILYMAGAPTDEEARRAVVRYLGSTNFETVERSLLGTDTMWRLRPVTAKEGR
jgi:diaminohydroxyphosphoribosylaminopyrimidine deaminase/5-amino-6-(5-phosphoribosylamino)uracil reductase